MLKTIIKSVAVTAVAAVSFSSGAFAQTQKIDTTFAKVPFRVNVDAKITAVQGVDTVSKSVTGKTTGADTLKIPLEIKITNAVRHTSATQGKQNAPIVSSSRGNITLRLPTQSYQNSEVVLHSVNGKRILRVKANASESVSGVSRSNVAAGVYLLSVKGINGNTFSTRMTHNGGNISINVAFDAESVSPARQLGKKADVEDGDWEITVSANVTGMYKDSTYTLNLTAGDGYTLQNITLIMLPPIITTFTDERDGKPYKKVTIGTQTWMAENLNYAAYNSVCYENREGSCAVYGRLYRWSTAMNGESSSNKNPSNVRGVCPAGWHLPSDAEWTQLQTYVGSNAGTKLKSTNGWSGDGSGTDDYGFSALPGGIGTSLLDDASAALVSSDVMEYGYWWSSTQRSGYDGIAYSRIIRSDRFYYGYNVSSDTYSRMYLLSVRCVQD
jgi:uncharacterized protein (TIGR02145 family)